ncbi:MAG: DUF4440 domain-containing protein [Pyrinomonadaceae bacterium]
MKRCPTCNETYPDQNLSFCIDDGTPLVPVTLSADETTVVSPSPDQRSSNQPSAPGAYVPRDWQAPDYQPPGSSVPPGKASKRKVWPWVVGILAVAFIGIVGIGIVAAILIPNMIRASSNQNRATANANIERRDNENSNLGSNSAAPNSNLGNLNENTNIAPAEDATTAPNDKDKVLAYLRDLENEWTAANINADKQKLDKILADDYVGQTSEGKAQGKADYLKTIERDTSIQGWDFEDLKVDLKGDRAALSGIIRLKLRDREVAYDFTDKFVWRDGRWQAVGSEVSLIEP